MRTVSADQAGTLYFHCSRGFAFILVDCRIEALRNTYTGSFL